MYHNYVEYLNSTIHNRTTTTVTSHPNLSPFGSVSTNSAQTSNTQSSSNGMRSNQIKPSVETVQRYFLSSVRKQLKKVRQVELNQGVKELYFCSKEEIAVMLTTDSILVLDTYLGEVISCIKKLPYPRHVRLAKDGSFILAYYSNNTVAIMDLHGREISNVLGVPRSSTIFLISDNCRKLVYGNNQTICLWNIETASIEVLSKQWKNINCYAIDESGDQLALGTYSGSIFILKMTGEQKCTQIELKRHKSCVMALTFNGTNIASVSYDKVLLESTIETNEKGEKIITYFQHKLEEIPRELICCDGKVFLGYMEGLFWFNKDKLLGFDKGKWNVFENSANEIVYVKYDKANIQWWKFEEESEMGASNKERLICCYR